MSTSFNILLVLLLIIQGEILKFLKRLFTPSALQLKGFYFNNLIISILKKTSKVFSPRYKLLYKI